MYRSFHGIKVVAQRTGLTAHVIRIWEKRYKAVEPTRTETKRRLYSEEQIERLILLKEITQKGHSIGNVANMPIDELRQLSDQSQVKGHSVYLRYSATQTPETFINECIAAVQALDHYALEESMKRAMVILGAQGLLQRVVAPLIQVVGDLWNVGTLTAAHEHFASAVIRVFLGHAVKPFTGTGNSPGIIVATPTGQIHELGALLVGAAAANMGWQVTYLGASLPAAEIVGAVIQKKARVVALSIVYPGDDPQIEEELKWLRDLLPPEVVLVVGGRAITEYQDVLENIGALQIQDLSHFTSTLNELRKSKIKQK